MLDGFVYYIWTVGLFQMEPCLVISHQNTNLLEFLILLQLLLIRPVNINLLLQALMVQMSTVEVSKQVIP